MRPPAARRVPSRVTRAAATACALVKSKSTATTTAAAKSTITDTVADSAPVLRLGELVTGVVVKRPSERNKSPYVGDVRLDSDGRIVIVHMPSMDCGGKCVPGAPVLVKPARDKKGNLVGGDAVGPYGTPKCEFIMQLLRVSEPENANLGGVWIGAHPSLGEKIANELIRRQRVPGLAAASEIQREVAGVAGCDMRTDFLLSHEAAEGDEAEGGGASKTVVEVKTVVDTDYDPATPPPRKECRFLGAVPYSRAGIFPWGRSAQKGPDGEAVVSARAIKHVDELAAISRGERTIRDVRLRAAVLFIVTRNDAASFRPNSEACPSFARHLRDARDAGVAVLAHRVRWGEGADVGNAFCDGPLAVDL